ncbi:MAG TPA: SRPBCC domain-containing protein [Chloroflexota bacterium]|nr:SRPBCC domain-containing protein [Chloroflexota bacterium]
MSPERTRAPLVYNATVGVPAERVFEAFFREPQRWLCRSGSVEARVGGELRLCFPDGCFAGRFVQCEPPTLARFSWRMDGDELPETMVVVRFQPDGDGTALELEHYGFGVGDQWDMLYVGCARAWASYLKNLRAVVELGTDLREADE